MTGFPILKSHRNEDAPDYVPWSLVEDHDAQAQRNHSGQTLERLAQRGGLGVIELWAVCHDMPYPRGRGHDEADPKYLNWLKSRLAMPPIAPALVDQRLRSEVLRKAPKGEMCVMCAENPAVALCHLPHAQVGFPAGMAQKTHDWNGAHLCQRCHDYADGADGRNDIPWRTMAAFRTIQRLFARGVLLIPGEDHADPDGIF